MFFRGMEAKDLQESADCFQNEKSCKFLICDESGGEGRNFQIADYIVHFDLPWSPAALEQRIGRLDRIGRDKERPVKSVVMIPEGTLEEQLFELYRDVFKIFDYSLCGLEIAFEEIQRGIDSALCDDLRYGLMKYKGEFEAIIKRTNEEVEDERYFDQGRYALNEELQKRIGSLIHQFTYDDGKELMDAMLAWTSMAGIRANIEHRYGEQKAPLLTVRTESDTFSMKSMQNALYRPKRMDEIVKRAYTNHMFQGTFSREVAINHENVTFLAPYHPFFDSILDNAMESYRGRSCAMQYKRAPIDWCGFLLTWNVHFNPSKVFEQGFPEEIITIVSRYLPLKQFFTCTPINDASRAISKDAVIEAIRAVNSGGRPEHLGKRGDKDERYKGKRYPIDDFVDKLYPEIWDRWTDRAYESGYKEVVDEMQFEIPYRRAKEDLENLLVANEARYRFYGEDGKKAMIDSQEMVDALLYGLEHPHISLDSMVFYWLKKEE
jgi:ATP-dependent helicase HepA